MGCKEMELDELKQVYLSRPFKTRNADEFELQSILDLFIDPTDGLDSPFDYCNSIVKGKMGSGKTMYLRANHAYYLYTLVPCLNDNQTVVLPVYLKLSDFANIQEPEEIYRAIIVKTVEEIAGICDYLQSSLALAKLHVGAASISGLWPSNKEIHAVLDKLQKLTSDEYVRTVSTSLKGSCGLTAKFATTCAEYGKTALEELKRHEKPSFQWVVDACRTLIEPFDAKLLILLDEVSSLSKQFFRGNSNTDSYFETLMNQFRTLSYVRTKLAIYPHSASDVLQETRYGDCVELECDPVNHITQYEAFLSKTASLIERYIETESGIKCDTEDVFDISVQDQLLLEQLINASEGNMRRLVHLLDISMNVAFKRCRGVGKVSLEDIMESLRRQGVEMESLYQDADIDYLNRLAKVCRSRSTYRFTFPNKSNTIIRYTNRSAEYNIVNIRQAGAGRQGTIYSFDYAYCIYKDLPTHYVKGTEKIDKSRSIKEGEPIRRVAQLSDEVLAQLEVHEKIEGIVLQYTKETEAGVVQGSDEKIYILIKSFVIKSDIKKDIRSGTKVRFLPSTFSANQTENFICLDIEIL